MYALLKDETKLDSPRLRATAAGRFLRGWRCLKLYDYAKKLRDDAVTVVGGFHSPVEKERLRILLRGI